MARHCIRKTRGAAETLHLIETLLLSLSGATDTLGVPLFRDEIKDIWEEQKRHLLCLQDPPGIQLYTITGHLSKGGVQLPILRSAQGTTSLESFHLHIARFIPGTSASDVHYQAYLLEGLVRWNSSRAAAAVDTPSEALRTFDTRLQQRVSCKLSLSKIILKVNELSTSITKNKVFPNYQPSAKYTGELWGRVPLFSAGGYTDSL